MTKTWQEEKLNELVRDLCSVEFRVKSSTRKRLKQFITDLRKQDEEELIKMLNNFPEKTISITYLLELIKDYYAK